MTDEERLDALLRRAETEQERLELLKWQHREAQKARLEEARQRAAGQRADKESQRDEAAAAKHQDAVEKRLAKINGGKEYMHGEEAKNVREELDREDAELRQKDRLAERVAKLEAKEDKGSRATETTKDDVNLKEGKKKVREAMSFLLKSSKAKDLRLKEDREKEKDRDWEPE